MEGTEVVRSEAAVVLERRAQVQERAQERVQEQVQEQERQEEMDSEPVVVASAVVGTDSASVPALAVADTEAADTEAVDTEAVDTEAAADSHPELASAVRAASAVPYGQLANTSTHYTTCWDCYDRHVHPH